MIGLARRSLAARSAATAQGCVATIGKTAITPGGVNAIPSAVTGWLDARGADEAALRRTVDEVTAAAADWGATVTEESWTADHPVRPRPAGRLRRVLPAAPLLGTGAGHDAGILAGTGIPTGMIFVRNPTGISHSPAEHAERVDCLAGVDALTAALTELVGPETAGERP